MASKINTTKNMSAPVTDVELKSVLGGQAKAFQEEEKVKLTIPKLLEKRLGTEFSMSINGVVITVPVDGKAYEVNKTHAEHIMERLSLLNN